MPRLAAQFEHVELAVTGHFVGFSMRFGSEVVGTYPDLGKATVAKCAANTGLRELAALLAKKDVTQ